MATFVRLQIQLLGKSSSALVTGVQGEVLGDSDLGGPQGAAAVVLGVLAGGGGGGGALVRVSSDGGADGPRLVLTGGGSGRADGRGLVRFARSGVRRRGRRCRGRALLFPSDRRGRPVVAPVHLLFDVGPLAGCVGAEYGLSQPLHRPALQFGHDLGEVRRGLFVHHGHMAQDVPFAARLVAAQRAAVELDEDVRAVGVKLNVFGEVLPRAKLPLAEFAEELFKVEADRE